ncbi:MAG: biotin--[acetyl-CoA-carboxylase] ligase [Prevotellaceae bacterium]|jgi:BirA family biotin operon repressor/biotin-[acetyl-CoA-carboxylase] ligase|nr:biotin--[acetyl-CoA-carboxylase] ligase [Prevotellaceae bacterium]
MYKTISLGTLIGKTVLWYEEVDSTNNVAAKLLTEGCEDGTVVTTDFQTKGRGQQTKGWESEPKKNLMFTVIFKPTFLKVEDQFLLSKVVSLGVVDFLAIHGLAAKIKWPNDIYIGDKKITGILIEHNVMGNTISDSIAGIGININQAAFLSDAPNPTSVRIESEKELNIEQSLKEVLGCIEKRYIALSTGYVKDIEDCYFDKLYRLNKLYPYERNGVIFKAKIVGIKNTGELILEDESGKQQHYAFKEVNFSGIY